MNPTTSPAPQQWTESYTEIQELAQAIRHNLKEDASPRVQDDKWVITAAAHALVILDNVELATKHAAAVSEENERLKREVGELNRRLEEQHKLYCEETKRHNATWAKIHAATGYLNKEFKKLPEDLLEAVKEVVFRVTLVEIGRDNLRADLTALRQWTEQAREAMADAERYLVEHGCSHEYPVLINLRALLQSHPAKGMEGRGSVVRRNGGVECDTETGPCACGAWHDGVKSSVELNRIYDLLVEIGGAEESMRGSFVQAHIDKKHPCNEWRFCGHLGFGGKYRSTRNSVDCYREDETPLRLKIIGKLNAALSNPPTP